MPPTNSKLAYMLPTALFQEGLFETYESEGMKGSLIFPSRTYSSGMGACCGGYNTNGNYHKAVRGREGIMVC